VAGPVGQRIDTLKVAELTEVVEGQVLATLESHDEFEAALALARRNLESAVRRRGVVDRLSEARNAALEAETVRRQAYLDQQRSELNRLEPLFAQGIATDNDVVRQRLVVRQAQESLATGKADLDVEHAEHARRLEELRLEPLRAEVALAQARVDRSVVKAPSKGMVLRLLARAGEAVPEDGILTLADTSEMIALVEIYESDLRFVELGQKATLSSPALNTPLTGRVRLIGREVARNKVYDLDPAADRDARVVEVEVALDDPEVASRFVSLEVDAVIDVAGTKVTDSSGAR